MKRVHETTRVFYMDPRQNVYVPPGALERIVGSSPDAETLARLEGRWVRHGNKAYTDVWKPDLYAYDEEGFSPEDWGSKYDATEQVTREIFHKPLPFIGGADFNYDPFTFLVAKIFAADRSDPSTWEIAFVDEMVTKARDSTVAAKEFARRAGGRYKDQIGIVCDANGFHKANRHGGQERRTSDAYRYNEQGLRTESPIRGKGTKKTSGRSNPGIGDSRTVVRRLMAAGHFKVNAGNCVRMMDMLTRAPFGRKKPNEASTWTDRNVYNLEDSMRYLIWRVFSKRVERTESKVRIAM